MGNDEARLKAALARPAGESSDYDLNPGLALPPDRALKEAAVLVAVWQGKVLLTKRASGLKHHPGQIAFPGGKVDAGDDGVVGAALREAGEEIGLAAGNVQVLGTLPAHETVTGYRVTPVLGLVRAAFDAAPQESEVAEAFSVPLSHVTNPANFAIEQREWRGVWRRYYAVPYGPYYIWGATARILR
ncbi:MAG: CoA pyrophosphatase, partial [Paracoccaceae bacterium]